MKRSRLEGEKK